MYVYMHLAQVDVAKEFRKNDQVLFAEVRRVEDAHIVRSFFFFQVDCNDEEALCFDKHGAGEGGWPTSAVLFRLW